MKRRGFSARSGNDKDSWMPALQFESGKEAKVTGRDEIQALFHKSIIAAAAKRALFLGQQFDGGRQTVRKYGGCEGAYYHG